MTIVFSYTWRLILTAAVLLYTLTPFAYADHSWGNYHWATSGSSFVVPVGDSVTASWDVYLDEAIADWSDSAVLDLHEVAGMNVLRPKTCKPVAGRIEACNAKYGNNSWLGIAQIWVSGSHITQATAKMNDTYFTQAYYNTPAWKRLVMCQEVAHGFGLDHQDEVFNNTNLGSCMDYTNNPDGGAGGASAVDPSNEHPNVHDYEQLDIMYAHNDVAQTTPQTNASGNYDEPSAWGRGVAKDASGKENLFERDLGNGQKLITHVFWVEERAKDSHR
jgi:hypothetical protein